MTTRFDSSASACGDAATQLDAKARRRVGYDMASTSRAATDVDAHGVLYPRCVSSSERANDGDGDEDAEARAIFSL